MIQRAFRICDHKYLNDEVEHIYEAFQKLKYPKGFLIKQKKTAESIRNRSQNQNKPVPRRKKQKWISIPSSKKANVIARSLAKADVNVAINSGTKIKDVIDIKPKNTSATSDMSVVY